MSEKRAGGLIQKLLDSPDVRRVRHEGRVVYSAVDIVAVLTGSSHPGEYWEDLKKREPVLGTLGEVVEFGEWPGNTLHGKVTEALDLSGVLRVVQSVSSPRAEKLKKWLAESARRRLEEAENPELAVLRARRDYARKGHNPRWIDQRMRSISARHELTSEWYKRGARESEQFRGLTNELMRGAFGMDVESYRRHKGLTRSGETLRDYMTDVELALTSLAETAAVVLGRERESSSYEQLLADAKDAAAIVGKTRLDLEDKSGRPVVYPAAPAGRAEGRPGGYDAAA